MALLQLGSEGPDVGELQRQLEAKGFSPGAIDGEFGTGTQAAVLAFQRSEGLLADGIAGPHTLDALGHSAAAAAQPASVLPAVTLAVVSRMFPATPLRNIKTNLPPVLKSLVDASLADKPMVLMALSTIRAETEGFEPIPEFRSRFNTSPNGHPFDLYDNRRDLGNRGAPDGERFRGRGFIQLTGRFNYQKYGPVIGRGDQLVNNPELACDPEVAADLLAAFLKDKERRIKEALLEDDLKLARRLVNGGSHGVEQFTEAYRIGQRLIT